MSETTPPEQELSAQDVYLHKMLMIANALMAGAELLKAGPLSAEAAEEALKAGFALSEMLLEMHAKLSSGAAAPTAWQMDRQLMVNADGVPASTLHEELKAQIELSVMQLIRQFESLGKKTGAKLSAELGRMMVLNGRLTAESVRIAVAHRLRADQMTGGVPELIVKRGDLAEQQAAALASVETKTGRASDQED